MHYDEIPDDQVFITDGNPIYNADQLFYHINGTAFELHQVIGIKNKYVESKKWRLHKLREERFNRTYKQNYYGTNGYDGLEGANRYMVLYVAVYNFLRRHSSLGNRMPVDEHLFDDCTLVHEKWLKIIEMSTDYAM